MFRGERCRTRRFECGLAAAEEEYPAGFRCNPSARAGVHLLVSGRTMRTASGGYLIPSRVSCCHHVLGRPRQQGFRRVFRARQEPAGRKLDCRIVRHRALFEAIAFTLDSLHGYSGLSIRIDELRTNLLAGLPSLRPIGIAGSPLVNWNKLRTGTTRS